MLQEEIKEIITRVLQPSHLEICDESEKHASHAGAKAGGGHFILLVVSEIFEQKSLMQRHKMVYQALQHLMKQQIHALSIKTYTPAEYKSDRHSRESGNPV